MVWCNMNSVSLERELAGVLCVRVCVCTCVCECVCVCERENVYVCVCVCVCRTCAPISARVQFWATRVVFGSVSALLVLLPGMSCVCERECV